MATFQRGDATIRYEEYGSGFPVLLIAPGGMHSTVEFWQNAPWNPAQHLASRFRVIAMDQRNAGGSHAPVRDGDGWAEHTADQLALLDHLGVERCHVQGMCIGGPYILALLKAAPERFAAAVLMQPIGLAEGDANRELFFGMVDNWAGEIAEQHPEAGPQVWAALRENMFGGANTLFTVPDAELSTITTPMVVLLGNDEAHPQRASRLVAAAAPQATLVEDWKQPADVVGAQGRVDAFLAEHTPAGPLS